MFGFGRFCKKYYRDLKSLRCFVKELRRTSLDELKAEKISLIDRLERLELDLQQSPMNRIKGLETINEALSERLWQVEKLESIAPQLEKPILYIHGGAGKSGSSTIQHYLADNRYWLEAHGIYYPFSDSLPPLAGNLANLWHKMPYMTDTQLHEIAISLKKQASIKSLNILLSLESIAQALPIRIKRFCHIFAPYFHLELIGFVRDPLNWSYSAYCHLVKNHLETRNFIDFVNSKNPVPNKVQWRCENIDIWLNYGTKLCFFSFEEHKAHLLQTFMEALGLPLDQMPPPSQERVNESLPDSTLAFMLAFNTVPALATNNGLLSELLTGLDQSSGPSKVKSRPNRLLAPQAYTNHKEMIQKLRPYLAEERFVLDHSSDEPSQDNFNIEYKDAVVALDIITRYLSGQRVPESISST